MSSISIKQKEFINNYTNPNSETYDNGTKSVMKAYNTTNENSAGAMATHLLGSNKIQKEIDRILESMNMSYEVRLKLISDIAGNHTTRKVITRHYNKKTKTMQLFSETESPPTTAERLKALDMLCRLTGDYEKARIASNIAKDEYMKLRNKLLKDNKKANQRNKKGVDTSSTAE